MKTKAELREEIHQLKRENLALIIECNAARARAGENYEALMDYRHLDGAPPLMIDGDIAFGSFRGR